MEHLYETLAAANEAPQSNWREAAGNLLSHKLEVSRYVVLLATIVMVVVIAFEATV